MPLMPLQIKPGIHKETPSLTSEPAWRDADKVRFKAGQPEKIGGWESDLSGINALNGVARSVMTWRLNNGLLVTAIGTHEKLYLWQQSIIYDITPLRETQALGTDPFSTSSGSTTVTVTDTAHGAANNDYVTFSGAVCATLVDSEVNANHQITLVDANTYTFEVTTAASGTDAADGGASVTAEYEINVGFASAISQFGYGAGTYGAETYGDERSVSSNILSLRYWSLDHFGEDLVACHESGRIYQWTYSGSFDVRATLITNSPTYSDLLIVTNPDRHLVAFATETTGTQDKMLVAWADQETTTDWTPTAENTAGDHIISGGSAIVAAHRSQNATFIWTDAGLHSMQFIGPPFTFGFTEIGTNCGAISKGSIVNKDTILYWMGKDDFFIYDGVVRVLPCSVHRYVFKNIQNTQRAKVTVGLIKEFDEVIWFYPASPAVENTNYVIYNYEQQIWYTGTLVRTAWQDSELLNNPVGITDDGTIYHHEVGVNDDTSAMTAYIESAEFDVDQGDRFFFLRRAIPDMTINAGSVDYIFKTRRYPHSTQTTDTTSTVTSSTEKLDLRIRTRNLAVRVESDALDDDWRMGTARIDIRPDGRR
jgi:hypothetical protein